MKWYISGTAPHYWDGSFTNKPKYKTLLTPHERPKLYVFSDVGPFYSLQEVKKWVYTKRLLWIEQLTYRLHQTENLHIKAKKNLGYYAAKEALHNLEEKYPEIKI